MNLLKKSLLVLCMFALFFGRVQANEDPSQDHQAVKNLRQKIDTLVQTPIAIIIDLANMRITHNFDVKRLEEIKDAVNQLRDSEQGEKIAAKLDAIGAALETMGNRLEVLGSDIVSAVKSAPRVRNRLGILLPDLREAGKVINQKIKETQSALQADRDELKKLLDELNDELKALDAQV